MVCNNKESHSGTNKKNKSKIKWLSMHEGLKQSKLQKKPIFIDLYAAWCRYCKIMEHTTFSDKKIIDALNKKFISIKIYVDRKTKPFMYNNKKTTVREFTARAGVRGLPTVLFLDKNQKLVTALPGYLQAEALLPVFNYMSKECYAKKIMYKDYVTGKVKCN
mgnify:CR=1 FL=1